MRKIRIKFQTLDDEFERDLLPPRADDSVWREGSTALDVGRFDRIVFAGFDTRQNPIICLQQTRPIEPRARRTDPKTSHAAARSVRNVGVLHKRILDALRAYGPMHDRALIHRLTVAFPASKASASGIRSRRSELVALGYVEASKVMKKLENGNRSKIWKLTHAGAEIARAK